MFKTDYEFALPKGYVDKNGKCCTKKWGISILVEDVCESSCDIRSFFDVKQIGTNQYIIDANPTSNGFTSIVNYTWTVDGVPFTPTNPETWVSTLGSGSHEICLTVYGLTAKGECCSDTYCTEIFVTQKSSKALLEKVSMYPNPSRDQVIVDLSRIEGYSSAQIVIVNSIGDEVYRSSTIDNAFKFNTASWSKGIYHCKIQIGEDIIYKNLSVK